MSVRDNFLAFSAPIVLTEAASLMMIQKRLLHDPELASFPQILQMLFNMTNAVISARAMMDTF